MSPRARRLAAPSWLDGRLVLGVLLVLVSVVVGARLLSSADASQSVWVLTRDLAPGSTLADGDLESGRVQLYDSGGRYVLATGAKPSGYVLQRGLGAGELLPRDSLVRPDEQGSALRDVSVPVAAGHLPEDLQSGQQVDVYVTAGPAGSTAGGTTPAPESPGAATRLVLSRATVTLRPQASGLGGGSASSVVLSVGASEVAGLVRALQGAGVDLVRVPRGQELPAVAGPPVQAG